MYVFGSLCVFVDKWSKKRFLSSESLSSVRLSRISRFVYFGTKTKPTAVSAWTYETESKGQKKSKWCWSVRSETPEVRGLRSQNRDAGKGSRGIIRQHWVSEDDAQWWVNIFGSCVGFYWVLVRVSHKIYSHTECQKYHKLHFLAFCCSGSVFCLFFSPSSLCFHC